MRCHISAEDAGAHAFVRNDRDIKKGVARPVVAVGFSINDVAELATLGDLRFQLQRITGLVWAINHDDAIGRGHEPMVTAPYLGLCKDVAGQLLHIHILLWNGDASSVSYPCRGVNTSMVDRLSVYESSIYFLGRDREVLDPYADSIGHSVGDGRCYRRNRVLPNAPGVIGARAALRG